MSAHRILHDMFRAPFLMADPGDAGTITVNRDRAVVPVVTVAAETRTLAVPTKAGLMCMVVLDVDGGVCTLTVTSGYNQAATTTIVFGDAGDFVIFVSVKIGATYRWRLVAQEGTNAVMTDVTATTVTLADDAALALGTGSDAVLKWNGTYLEHGPATGLWAGAPSEADPQYHTIAHKFFDDFYQAPVDANGVWFEWDDAGTGTNSTADGVGGIGTVVTAGTDNDYHAISSLNEVFKFATGKKLWFEARFKVAEATTDESAWWFGVTDTETTGGLQAHDAGPLASYDGFLIWKDEDTMTIDSELSEGAHQDTDAAEATFVTDTWTRVGFYYDGGTAITPYYDVGAGWVAGTAKAFGGDIGLADMGEMHVVAGIKTGPTAAAETLQIDYIKCVQLR